MKKIKTFELYSYNIPDFGDFAICTDVVKYDESDGRYIMYINFLNNNIGTFVGENKNNEIYKFNFLYKNVPEIIHDYFSEGRSKYIHDKTSKILNVTGTDILHTSKSKEELELIIAANKYNL